MMRLALRLLFAALTLLVLTMAALAWLGLRDDPLVPSPVVTHSFAEQIARGAYLAKAGNCMACHTARGGTPYAGGRGIATPFGTIYGTNITSDRETGIGTWSADDFWRALHNGKSKDGTLLYPAFPFPNTTKVTRADADAIYAYLQSLPPVKQANREPELRFPYNQRWLLAGWRALYFRPGVIAEQPQQTAEWNRGRYLVQGLGHCNACHTPRNALGAITDKDDLSGAMLPMLGWYASSLAGGPDGGLADWEQEHLVDLLKTGVSMRGAVSGPMAEVVRESLQHLSTQEVQAMAVYLQSLPQGGPESQRNDRPASRRQQAAIDRGAQLYEQHCVACHKADGRGEPPAYPPLAGSRSARASSPVNAIRLVLHGGYPPSTEGNPRPFGMPPLGMLLNDQEVADVVTYVRHAWGNRADMVMSDEVNRYRAVPLE